MCPIMHNNRTKLQYLFKMDSQSIFLDQDSIIQSQEVFKKPKRQMIYESSSNSGPWNNIQSFKYILFIEKNRQKLASKSKRRIGKIFKQMSLFLQTRNAIQCRSHHQKQLSKFKNITKIVRKFKKMYGEEKFFQKSLGISSIQSQKQKQILTIKILLSESVIQNNENDLSKAIKTSIFDNQIQFPIKNDQSAFASCSYNQFFPISMFYVWPWNFQLDYELMP